MTLLAEGAGAGLVSAQSCERIDCGGTPRWAQAGPGADDHEQRGCPEDATAACGCL